MFVIDVFDLNTGECLNHEMCGNFFNALEYYAELAEMAEACNQPRSAILYMGDTGEIIHGFGDKIYTV